MPDSVKAKRYRQRQRQAQMGKAFSDSAFTGHQPKFDVYAVDLDIDLTGDVVSERAPGMANNAQSSWLGDGDAPAESARSSAQAKVAAGWDYIGPTIKRPGFTGRTGHVRVLVSPHTFEIPAEKIAQLAARVRDRIVDLPFGLPADHMQSPAAVSTGSRDDDPCRLLTRTEAEAVLGKLIVAPYRAAKETPFVDPIGTSCAYFTAGHRVLVLTPEWSFGKNKMEAVRGIGGLTASIAADLEAEAVDTLEGPWDDVAADGKTGEVFFLKGDRLLQIAYATSSTNSAGAVRLARIALQRM